MPFHTTARLISKYGHKKILWLLDALNNGTSQQEIAAEFGLSKARMSQICSRILRRQWEFNECAEDAIKFEIAAIKRELVELRRAIPKNPRPTKAGKLQLVKSKDP
jgi:hypothetical protein